MWYLKGGLQMRKVKVLQTRTYNMSAHKSSQSKQPTGMIAD